MPKVFAFLFILILGLGSCKKDSDDSPGCTANWAAEVQSELTAVSNAAAAYGNNPTHETCVAYKDAYQDYIDALRPFLKCSVLTLQQKADLQDAIDEAEADLSDLCTE